VCDLDAAAKHAAIFLPPQSHFESVQFISGHSAIFLLLFPLCFWLVALPGFRRSMSTWWGFGKDLVLEDTTEWIKRYNGYLSA